MNQRRDREDLPLPTVRMTLEAGHGVWVTCAACHRSVPFDLPDLVASGRGDVALRELPLRCLCGSRGGDIGVQAGRAHVGSVTP